MISKRMRFTQSGTGQVGYLSADKSGCWVFDLFMGGPQPLQRAGEWNSHDEAVAALTESGFSESLEE